MTLLNNLDDVIKLTMKPGTEMAIPDRGPFCSFPKLRVTKIVQEGKEIRTDFWPTAGSLPSTRHSKTIRYINLAWNDIKVNIEYDYSSNVIKVLEGNVDSVTIEVS